MSPFVKVGVEQVFIPLPLLPQVEPLLLVMRAKHAMQNAEQQTQHRYDDHRRGCGQAPQLVRTQQDIPQAQLDGPAVLIRAWNPGLDNQVKGWGHESSSVTCRPSSLVRTSV